MSRSRKLISFLFALSLLAGCGRQDRALPAMFSGRDPRLLWDSAGRLHVVYVESRPDGTASVLYRRFGKEPAGPVKVSPSGLAAATSGEFPPSLDLLPDGTLVTGYSVSLPGKWQSEIRVQRSTDGGKTWGEPRLLHPPGGGAHSFLSSATSTFGTVTFAWLDKTEGQMGLRTATTRDGGAFAAAATVDAKTCQCCGTEMVAGRKGRLWLAYRDLEADDLRDFRVLSASADPPVFREEAKLSEDGWHINGCPETGARLAEAPDGTLWGVWFTGGGEPGLYVTSSRDGGAHFAPRTLLTAPGHMGRHPEIGALADGRIAVLYETIDGGTPSLQARVRDLRGAWGPPRTLALQGTYPRLASREGRTVVAFTCQSHDEPRVLIADWQDLEGGGKDLPDCAVTRSTKP